MSDIFISYAREDETRAHALADALSSRGWSIFWDRRIPHGRNFREHIDDELRSARCILVLWSKASLVSQFVLDEAAEGLDDGRLVPALIEAVTQPLGFRGLQAANLADWSSAATSHDEFDRLVSSILERLTVVGGPTPPPPITVTPRSLAGRLSVASREVLIAAAHTRDGYAYFSAVSQESLSVGGREFIEVGNIGSVRKWARTIAELTDTLCLEQESFNDVSQSAVLKITPFGIDVAQVAEAM